MKIESMMHTPAVVPNPRLVSAAHEFEASLMQELLKPMQQDTWPGSEEGGDSQNGSGSSSTLMSFGSEALAKSLSEHGGLGIARTILQRLGPTPQVPTTHTHLPGNE